MVVSLKSASPGSFLISGPAIQAIAVTTNTAVTRRSAVDIGPSAVRASISASRAVACDPMPERERQLDQHRPGERHQQQHRRDAEREPLR